MVVGPDMKIVDEDDGVGSQVLEDVFRTGCTSAAVNQHPIELLHLCYVQPDLMRQLKVNLTSLDPIGCMISAINQHPDQNHLRYSKCS